MNQLSETEVPKGDPGLKVTLKAASHIQSALKETQKESAIGIRVNVKKAGCSGYEYVLEYATSNSIGDMDFVFNDQGVTVVVDKEIYLKFLKGGTILDFFEEGLNQGLKFNNPNVGSECGCGESFQLVEDERK